MEKRDRYIDLLLHRRSETLILNPGVCYMAGVGVGYGTPKMLALSDSSAAQVGSDLVALLDTCKQADIDVMATHRKKGLRRHWGGNAITSEDIHPCCATDESTHAGQAIHERFPSIENGPAAMLRTFHWVQLIDRDSWKSFKLVRRIKSPYRGCVADGSAIRVSTNSTAGKLGAAALGFLRDPPIVDV